ncbi:MAG: 50S ribosomal protein L9 [Leptospiraceae bacterium]|nr:50S ribosomal protein L9 [Leptospiraceae bacterium]MDW7976724.1 50S ribosomal protein L9 [Leptospiraceae bacterium]
MKVILKQDIPNLGDAGDVVKVSPGFARNYLIPKKLVIPYDESSRKVLEHQKRIIEIKRQKRKKQVQEIAKILEELKEIEIPMRVGAKNKLYGSVTPAIVAKALEEKAKVSIDKRKILLNEPIKQLGDFKIKIELSDEHQVGIIVKVVPYQEESQETQEKEEITKTEENKEISPEETKNNS